MKVFYIHHYFRTPDEPGGCRSYWISKELVNRGHQVTMITSTNKDHPDATRVDVDGIDVMYVKSPQYSNYLSVARRIWAFIGFVFAAIKAAKKRRMSILSLLRVRL